MGCGASAGIVPRVTEVKEQILILGREEGGFDLLKIYKAWAKWQFTLTGKYKSGHHIEVDDKRVRCQKGETEYGSGGKVTPTSRVIYTGTQVIKNREDDLEFRFKQEKKTKAVAEIHLSKTLVKDGQGLGIVLKYPKLDNRSEFKKMTVLTGEATQTEEHELNWGVDTSIKAKCPGKRRVDLSVEEQNIEENFTQEVAFRGPLEVNLWDSRSGSKKLVSHVSGRAENVLCEMAGFTARIDKYDNQWAVYTMKGKCLFTYAIEQDTVVHPVEKVDSDDESEDQVEEQRFNFL